LAWGVTLLTYIRQTHGSTLGHDIDYLDFFPSAPPGEFWDITFTQTGAVSFQILSNTSFITLPTVSKLFLWSYEMGSFKYKKPTKMRHEITEFSLLKFSILLLENDVQLLDSTELHPSCAPRYAMQLRV
jgi:hypothetical protein